MAGKEGIIAAAITGASNISGGLISHALQKKENARQRDYEREMYQRNLDDNLAFWNMSNQYNSPDMQMQRLKAAGLNPNLAYGNGATATVENAKVPTPNTTNNAKTGVDSDTFSLAPAMNAYYSTQVQKGQANLLEQQALTQASNRELNEATAKLRILQAAGQQTTNTVARATIQSKIQQVVADVTKTHAQIGNINTDTGLKATQQRFNIENTKKIIDENKRAWQTNHISLKQMLQNITESKSRTQLNQGQLGLAHAQTTQSQISSLISQIDYEYKKKHHGKNPASTGVNRAIDLALEGAQDGTESIVNTLRKILSNIKK